MFRLGWSERRSGLQKAKSMVLLPCPLILMIVNDPSSSAHLPFARMREDSVMTSIRISPRLLIVCVLLVRAGQVPVECPQGCLRDH
jgi:hypothetical protein